MSCLFCFLIGEVNIKLQTAELRKLPLIFNSDSKLNTVIPFYELLTASIRAYKLYRFTKPQQVGPLTKWLYVKILKFKAVMSFIIVFPLSCCLFISSQNSNWYNSYCCWMDCTGQMVLTLFSTWQTWLEVQGVWPTVYLLVYFASAGVNKQYSMRGQH